MCIDWTILPPVARDKVFKSCVTVLDVPGWLVLWYIYPYTCGVLLSYCSGCSRVVGPIHTLVVRYCHTVLDVPG